MKKPLLMFASLVIAAFVAGYMVWSNRNADLPEITVWQSPTCGCCEDWGSYMRDKGFAVTSHLTEDVEVIKKRLGVPEELWSCHTAVIGDYIIEGHVPAMAVKKLITEKPSGVRGLSSPGMASGNAGMDGPRVDNVIVQWGQAGQAIFGTY